MHCLEDKLRPSSITELSCNLVMIEGHPVWSDRAKHAYGHLLSLTLRKRSIRLNSCKSLTRRWSRTECDVKVSWGSGLLRVLSWVSFDLPDHYKRTLSMLLKRQLAKGVAVYTRSQLKWDVRWSWHCVKSLQTKLMPLPNCSTRHVRSFEVSQTSHPRGSLTLKLPYARCVNWAASHLKS